MSSQGRNIILCFDGTSNEVSSTPTNVLRLCHCLVRDKQQIVFYAPGVGTLLDPCSITDFRKTFRNYWDLATGFSLRNNVIEGYLFLVSNYRSGDRIFLFGFSRGAYTARAVVGMLHMFGLLRQVNANLAPYIWQCYRNNIPAPKWWSIPLVSRLFKNQSGMFKDAAQYMELFAEHDHDSVMQDATAPVCGNTLKVEFVGVFDTVSSYLSIWWFPLGIAIFALMHFVLQIDNILGIPLWPFLLLTVGAVLFRWLPYTASMPNASYVRHAVALDEYRAFFPSNHVSGTSSNHKEVWFSGVHTDVGGGRPKNKSQLAMVSLRWMLGEAVHCGLRVDPKKASCQLNGLDEEGETDKSWSPVWLIPGAVPQLRLSITGLRGRESGKAIDEANVNGNERKTFIRTYFPNFWRFRYIREGDCLHSSVITRIKAGKIKRLRLDRELIRKHDSYEAALASLDMAEDKDFILPAVQNPAGRSSSPVRRPP